MNPGLTKHLARLEVARAIKSRKLIKPSVCPKCAVSVPARFMHGHHDDYSKPLDVQWMCIDCHSKHHSGSSCGQFWRINTS
jgi:hypothetical protein